MPAEEVFVAHIVHSGNTYKSLHTTEDAAWQRITDKAREWGVSDRLERDELNHGVSKLKVEGADDKPPTPDDHPFPFRSEGAIIHLKPEYAELVEDIWPFATNRGKKNTLGVWRVERLSDGWIRVMFKYGTQENRRTADVQFPPDAIFAVAIDWSKEQAPRGYAMSAQVEGPERWKRWRASWRSEHVESAGPATLTTDD